jgi:putative ABC transport system permease protein
MKASTIKVFKDVFHRKLRTILTVLGIAIGIIGLSAIGIANNQINNSFQYSSNTATQPDITFYTAPTSSSLVDLLQQQPNVKIVQADGSFPTRWKIATGHFPMTLRGIEDFHHVQLNKFEMVTGSLPGPKQILLESSDRAVSPVQIGDTIKIEAQGEPLQLTVSGFVRTQGRPSTTILGRALGYMNESDLESLLHSPGVNSFLFQLNNTQLLDTTAKQLSQVLEGHRVQIVATSVGQDTSTASLVDGLFGTMRVLSLIALLLSIFLLLGTVTSLVAEQLKIIGTMKSLGAGQWKVMRHYLSIVALYGIAGTVIGLALGILGGYLLVSYFANLLTLDMGSLDVPPLIIVESLAIGVGVPLLSAALPIYFGTRMTVHKALSGYGLDGGTAQHGARWGRATRQVLGFIPQTMQLGVRSLFRKRLRAILTLTTLTMAGAAFLAVQTTTYSFQTFLDQVFTTYHYHVLVRVPNPQPYAQLQAKLSTVPGVVCMEQLTWYDVQTQWGDGLLTGIEPKTQLYQKQLVAGRWFESSDQHAVIISQDAAEKSGLKVGDTISFHDALHSASWHIIGVVRDYRGIGPGSFGVLLTPITQVNAYLHRPAQYTSSVMIQTSDTSPSAVNALATRIDKTLSTAGLQANVITAQQQIQRIQGQFQILYVLLYTVAVIVALVGAIGLSNTLAMSVLERRREIGILRSMGATGQKVAQVFWTEGISQGMFSWLIALVLGIPGAYGFVMLLGKILVPVPFAFNPMHLVWMLGFIVLIASIASLGPVLAATRVRIAQTLQYE